MIENYSFLFPFQKEGIKDLLNGKKLLADEVGLGKTIQAMVYAKIKNYNKVLIICPAPLKQQWYNEIKKFLNEESVIFNSKNKKECFKNYNKGFLITNYESLKYFINQYYDLIILDEVHRIKNYRTLTYKNARLIKCKDKIGLTATPLVNNPQELFTICCFLKYFMSWAEFSSNYCEYGLVNIRGGRVIETIIGYKNLIKLHDRLNPLMIRRLKKDVLSQLPEKTFKTYMIDANQFQKEIIDYYYAMAKNAFSMNCGDDLLGFIQLARMSCDSTELIKDSDSKNKIDICKIESAKINVLKDILSQLNEKVIVFTQWKKMAEILNRVIPESMIISGDTKDKITAIDYFLKSNFKVLIATDCLNYGVNLQEVSVLIHFDLPWSPSRIIQREGRMDRIGQKNNMLIFNLVIKDSIEDKVLSLLNEKKEMFNNVVDGERMIINKLFSNKQIMEEQENEENNKKTDA